MRASTNIAALLLLPGVALAQFGAPAPTARSAFSKCPVRAGRRGSGLNCATNCPRPPSSPVSEPLASKPRKAADVIVAEKMERDRRVRELERQVADAEAGFGIRNQRMSAEIEQLHGQRYRAKNNLACATYEQSLATEMQAVAAKYKKALNDVETERLKTLCDELARAKIAVE